MLRRILSLAPSSPIAAVLVPPKLPAPLYKSLGLVMRPVTADAAATAGLAR
jgi:hypothetical protein